MEKILRVFTGNGIRYVKDKRGSSARRNCSCGQGSDHRVAARIKRRARFYNIVTNITTNETP